MILRRDPYRVLEGALVAAYAIGADRRHRRAQAYVRAGDRPRARRHRGGRGADWTDDVEHRPSSKGRPSTSTARRRRCSRPIDGRPPFPRIAPPCRQGVDEVVEHVDDLDTGSKSPAHVEMATTDRRDRGAAHPRGQRRDTRERPRIVADGAAWFRAMGTEKSPGTIVCTVTGQHAAPRRRGGPDGDAAAHDHRGDRRRRDARAGRSPR